MVTRHYFLHTIISFGPASWTFRLGLILPRVWPRQLWFINLVIHCYSNNLVLLRQRGTMFLLSHGSISFAFYECRKRCRKCVVRQQYFLLFMGGCILVEDLCFIWASNVPGRLINRSHTTIFPWRRYTRLDWMQPWTLWSDDHCTSPSNTQFIADSWFCSEVFHGYFHSLSKYSIFFGRTALEATTRFIQARRCRSQLPLPQMSVCTLPLAKFSMLILTVCRSS